MWPFASDYSVKLCVSHHMSNKFQSFKKNYQGLNLRFRTNSSLQQQEECFKGISSPLQDYLIWPQFVCK